MRNAHGEFRAALLVFGPVTAVSTRKRPALRRARRTRRAGEWAAGHLATFAGAVVTGSPAAPPDQQVQGRARIATLDDKATGNYLAGLHLRARDDLDQRPCTDHSSITTRYVLQCCDHSRSRGSVTHSPASATPAALPCVRGTPTATTAPCRLCRDHE